MIEAKGYIEVAPKMFEGANFAIKVTEDVVTKGLIGVIVGDVVIVKTTKNLREGEFCVVFDESKKISFVNYEKGEKSQVLGKIIGLIRIYQ